MNFIKYFLILSMMIGQFAFAQTYIKGPALIEGTTTVTAAAGTTTLTKDSNSVQIISGTTTQTVVLPSATTLPVGRSFEFYSTTTGIVSIQANGGTVLKSLAPNEHSKFRLTVNGTSAGTWAVEQNVAVNASPTTDWQTYTPTITGFGTPTAVSAEWRWNGDSVEIRGTFTSGTATAVEGRFSLPTNITTAGTTKIPTIRPTGVIANTFNGEGSYFLLVEPTTTYVTFGRQSSGTFGITKLNGSGFLGSGNQITFSSLPIPTSTGNNQAVVRMTQSNYDWRAYTPTIVGFGTPTSVNCLEKRDGADNLIRCSFVSGTSTAVTATVSIPNGNSIDSTKLPVNQKIGDAVGSSTATTNQFHVFGAPSATVINFTRSLNSSNGTSLEVGNNLIGSGTTLTFTARLPISGWTDNQNAPLLVGGVTSSSVGLEKIERAKINTICNANGACAIQNKTPGISAITRTAAGNYNITFTASNFSDNPTCTYSSNLFATVQIADTTTSGTTVRTRTVADVDTDMTYFNLICIGPR